MRRTRVLYYLWEYPKLSQTYVKSEIEALLPDYEIGIIACKPSAQPYSNHQPHHIAADIDRAREFAEDFKPDVLHTHWLRLSPQLAQLSHSLGVPFTVRSHSFDTLWSGTRGRWFERSPIGFRFLQSPEFAAAIPALRDDACLGVLGFPFVIPRFRKAGVPASKLHSSFPVVAVQRFLDRSPNGTGVICCGAAQPKKAFEDFLTIAGGVPNREFTLYPLGNNAESERMSDVNEAMGSPARVASAVDPDLMPAEFKRNEWLLYSGSRKYRSVGWPVSVAEAQASGVGVCIPELGRDVNEYLGGAGFTFTSLAEAQEIVSKPFPAEMRELGFEAAKRSDIGAHKHILTDLWEGLGST